MVLKLKGASASPGGFVKHRLLGPAPQFMIQWVWEGPQISLSVKFPGGAGAAGLGLHLEDHRPRRSRSSVHSSPLGMTPLGYCTANVSATGVTEWRGRSSEESGQNR